MVRYPFILYLLFQIHGGAGTFSTFLVEETGTSCRGEQTGGTSKPDMCAAFKIGSIFLFFLFFYEDLQLKDPNRSKLNDSLAHSNTKPAGQKNGSRCW